MGSWTKIEEFAMEIIDKLEDINFSDHLYLVFRKLSGIKDRMTSKEKENK